MMVNGGTKKERRVVRWMPPPPAPGPGRYSLRSFGVCHGALSLHEVLEFVTRPLSLCLYALGVGGAKLIDGEV